MDAEFSVELGENDPTLAVPWKSPDGATQYVDLRQHPERIIELSEVRAFPELDDFLRSVNASRLATAKCDAWFDQLMDVDDEPFEAAIKCASYVDVFFHGEKQLSDFPTHESVARNITARLRALENIAARAELIIRRGYFEDANPGAGFYWTIYTFGYGDSLQEARQAWRAALRQVQTALPHA